MILGLIGLTNSGKTTLFNALTGAEIEVTPYASMKSEPHIGVVNVMDPRVDILVNMYNPKKTVYAQIEYMDFAGMSEGGAKQGTFSANTMAEIKTADALALVLRNFQDEGVDDAQDEPNPLRDYETIQAELVISDLITIENRLERIELSFKRGIKTPVLQQEQKILLLFKEKLEADIPLREVELEPEDIKLIRGFQFLSRKPLMIILNSDEDRFGKSQDVIDKLSKHVMTIEACGKFEMELATLSDEDAELFMQDFGIDESVCNRLTKYSYDLLGYISFFTVGSPEVHAWTITRGMRAQEAAGKIHSDLERGFIRAECFTYDDLIELGSEKAIKEKGLFRLEGKEYIVQDGDILMIRFNV